MAKGGQLGRFGLVGARRGGRRTGDAGAVADCFDGGELKISIDGGCGLPA